MRKKAETLYKLIPLVMLVLFSIIIPAQAAESKQQQTKLQSNEGQTKKYPPYPDVWDWQDTTIQKASILVRPFSLHAMPDGDVLIEYDRKYTKGKKLEAHAATFFGRKKYAGKAAEQIVEDAERSADKKKKEKGMSSQFDYMQYEAVSQDGIYQIKSIYSYDLKCYAGANRYPYKLINTKTGEGKIFTVFRILNEEKNFYIRESCGQSEKIIKYKVESISGNFSILEDDSFLFQIEATGDVIRFDSNLKSKSNLVGDRYYLIENNGEHEVALDELERFRGRDYKDTVSPQIITNDLYDYLKSKKRRKEKVLFN